MAKLDPDETAAADAQARELRALKIFPRNLTARAATPAAGNPVSSRLESGVGNDYPGLEFDHRNLDRRFFPGLVFEFVFYGENERRGVLLSGIDLNDADLDPPTDRKDPDFAMKTANLPAISATLSPDSDEGRALRKGTWYISELKQGSRKHRLSGARGKSFEGGTEWYFVRGLVPGEQVSITLTRRDAPRRSARSTREITLVGWRRRFVHFKTGVIDPTYAAGELTQSLCSPWTHDFRDCSCNYWASNHPDIVQLENTPGQATLSSGDILAVSLHSRCDYATCRK